MIELGWRNLDGVGNLAASCGKHAFPEWSFCVNFIEIGGVWLGRKPVLKGLGGLGMNKLGRLGNQKSM